MRVELFYKTKAELLNNLAFVAPLYQGLCISAAADSSRLKINLPNKVTRDPLGEYVRAIREYKKDDPGGGQVSQTIQQCDICVHYSLKNNPQKDMTFQQFGYFMSDMETLRVDEVLLVSGSSKGTIKRSKNTVSCLEYFSKWNPPLAVKIAVAYNCYFPDSSEQQVELNRLKQKVATGLVKKVYLQFGTDTVALKSALESFENDLQLSSKKITVVGSLFIPSKQLLARFKFRPWNGVFLSESYLSDVSQALEITNDILLLYNHYRVEIVVESALKNAADISKLESIVGISQSSVKNIIPTYIEDDRSNKKLKSL